MADLQQHFNKFHSEIMLRDLDDNKILREKRDIITDKIRSGLKKKREDGETVPTFDFFNQGSYAMGTGIKPLTDNDYDIDVGLTFNTTRADYPDPTKLKETVYDTVKDHASDDDVKDPCIRIQYKKQDKDTFHVDLPIYAVEENDLFLARGKLHSLKENRIWEPSDPKELITLVKSRFSDKDEQDQLRRVVRCLKRWKDVKFSSAGDGAPTGIALTIAAYKSMQPSIVTNPFTGRKTPDDSKVILDLVKAMLSQFGSGRLTMTLIVKPFNDLLVKLTDNQMQDFKKCLEELRDALDFARTEPDPHEACKRLGAHFGDAFPVPDKKATAEPKGPAIVSHSSSA